MLIPDLAHQLLEDVFQGDDALGAAVLVHDDRHVVVLLPQGAQQLGDLGGTRGIQGGCDEVFHGGGFFEPGQVEVLFMYHANDVVDGIMIDGQAGITGFRKGLGQLFQRDVVLHGHHVHAGGQDLFHLHVVELNGAADELALAVGQLAVIFGLAHHGHELTLGDGIFLTAVDELAQQLFPLGKQPGQRGKEEHQQVEHRGHCRGNGLRHLLGQALGRYLAKDQHHDGEHHGGDCRAPLLPQHLGKQDGADGSGGNVDDIVADEDGGEQLVVFFRHGQHPGGGRVAVLRAAFQTDLVQGRECGLGGGEKGGECHQDHQRHQERNTAIVHNKGKSHSTFCLIFSGPNGHAADDGAVSPPVAGKLLPGC